MTRNNSNLAAIAGAVHCFDLIDNALDAQGPEPRIEVKDMHLVVTKQLEASRRQPEPYQPTGAASTEEQCQRIDAARHELKTRDNGRAYEQWRADHAQRRDGY